MSRIVRAFSVVTGIIAMVALPVSAAFAQVPPPEANGGQLSHTPGIVATHTVYATGPATLTVLVVAAIAVLVGMGLTQLLHILRRRTSPRRPAAAWS